MKINIKNGAPEFDNEAKKAIRFVCGYTTDLRKKLDKKVYREKVYNFLLENRLQIFGSGFWATLPNMVTEEQEYKEMDRFLWDSVRSICD